MLHLLIGACLFVLYALSTPESDSSGRSQAGGSEWAEQELELIDVIGEPCDCILYNNPVNSR